MQEIISAITKRIEDINNAMPSVNKYVLEIIAAFVREKINENFFFGGRWDGKGTDIFSGGNQKWTPLAESTKKRYRRLGYSLEPTLKRSGDLEQSIEVNIVGNSLEISANMAYARTHQEGGSFLNPGGTPYRISSSGNLYWIGKEKEKYVKDKSKVVYSSPSYTIVPPRPFITLTQEDMNELLDLLSDDTLRRLIS